MDLLHWTYLVDVEKSMNKILKLNITPGLLIWRRPGVAAAGAPGPSAVCNGETKIEQNHPINPTHIEGGVT